MTWTTLDFAGPPLLLGFVSSNSSLSERSLILAAPSDQFHIATPLIQHKDSQAFLFLRNTDRPVCVWALDSYLTPALSV